MMQFLFLLFLHGLGTLFGLLWRRSLPAAFICLSGLLWGGLLFVLASMAILVMGLPYRPISLAVVFGLLPALLLVLNAARGTLSITRDGFRRGLVWSGLPVMIFLFASGWNFTVVSPDSLYMILNGRAFSSSGFSLFIREQLALRGIYVQVLQAAGPLFGQDYLYALQPAFTLVSGVLFVDLGRRISKHLTPRKPPMWPLTAGLAALAGTYLVVFQTYYIHTNLLSGCFLMVGAACFWLGLREKNYPWLAFGTLALLSFSLLRSEAPLFALVYFLLLFSHAEIPYRVRLAVGLPYAVLVSGWYLYLLAGAGGSYILSPTNIGLMVLALAGFAGLLLASRVRWVAANILPRLPWILLVGAGGLCGFLALIDSARLWVFFETIVLNMTVYGLWGVTWFAAAAGLAAAAALPDIPYQRIFSFGISIFLILLLAVATQNVNHKLEWSDSANRMLTHILPTIFLYLGIKFSRALSSQPAEVEPLRKSRGPLLIGLGSGLVVFTLVVLLAG